MEWLSPFAFGVGDYAFWLLLVSALCFGLERAFPWRREQRALREGFGQDLFWLAFNGHVLGVLTWKTSTWLDGRWTLPAWAKVKALADGLHLLREAPPWAQLVVLLLAKDFLEWCVHNLLHRVPVLWQFHKVHHSIEQLDFLGNFRFHWFEVTVYWLCTSLPLAALGVHDGRVWMTLAVFSTLIGHLNHSNLNWSWGPLRYVLNSPRMHVWHHDVILRGGHGRNFGIVFSVWDWLFRTAELPEGQPARLGFEGQERYPRSLLSRLLFPVSLLWTPRAKPRAGVEGA